MDQYFDRMKTLAENQEFPKRIRFMLKDVIELRRGGWVPRKATSVEGPMPIHQVRIFVLQNYAVCRPSKPDKWCSKNKQKKIDFVDFQIRTDEKFRNFVTNSIPRPNPSTGLDGLFRNPLKTRGGLDDMLGVSNFSPNPQFLPHDSFNKGFVFSFFFLLLSY